MIVHFYALQVQIDDLSPIVPIKKELNSFDVTRHQFLFTYLSMSVVNVGLRIKHEGITYQVYRLDWIDRVKGEINALCLVKFC